MPDLWAEHVSRYEFAKLFAAGKRVLDVGCGTGYGTALLASAAVEAMGFDVSREAIQYAKLHFPAAEFCVGSASAFPSANASFDVVTVFEVIEHVSEWQTLIEESARVLRPGGVFLISTPNKVYYTETRKGVGPNPFHVHEFELTEFEAALTQRFAFVRILGQNRQEAMVFEGACEQRGRAFFAQETAKGDAHFFLAVCAAQPLEIPCFAYVANTGNLLREREGHIGLLQEQIDENRAAHLRLLEEHERLEAELQKQNAWAMGLDRELDSARTKLDQVHGELQQRTQWAQQLDAELQHTKRSKWFRLGRVLGLGPKPGQ